MVQRSLGFVLALLSLVVGTPSVWAQKAVPEGFKVDLLYQVPDIEHPSVVTCDDEGNFLLHQSSKHLSP